MLNMLMVSEAASEVIRIIDLVILALMFICALFIIIIVVMQPGNSNGVSALGGTTDTFLSKNKGKTVESKMRRLTVIACVLFAVLAIAFFILRLF